jgi:hypothetical protein
VRDVWLCSREQSWWAPDRPPTLRRGLAPGGRLPGALVVPRMPGGLGWWPGSRDPPPRDPDPPANVPLERPMGVRGAFCICPGRKRPAAPAERVGWDVCRRSGEPVAARGPIIGGDAGDRRGIWGPRAHGAEGKGDAADLGPGARGAVLDPRRRGGGEGARPLRGVGRAEDRSALPGSAPDVPGPPLPAEDCELGASVRDLRPVDY